MKSSFTERIFWPKQGHYVLALSGGVDSVALLDLLAQKNDGQWKLEIAHFDHGWSKGSREYAQLAREITKRYNLPFHSARRPVKRAEAEAREARYAYLREVKQAINAASIITAQHQDDLIETLLMNVARGTGRYGLSPFMNSPDIIRPLVKVRKSELVMYAKERGLRWIEDPSNMDMKFKRNRVRHEILPQLLKRNPELNEELVAITEEAAELNKRIDAGLSSMYRLQSGKAEADGSQLRRLPFATLTEVLVAMARAVQPGAELDRLAVEQLALDCKTGRLRQTRQLTNRLSVSYSRDRVITVFTP